MSCLSRISVADEEAMAAGEDGDEEFLEDAFLADDGLAHFLADAAVAVVEALDGGQVAFDFRPAFLAVVVEDDGLNGRFLAGEPVAAGAQTASVGGDLNNKAAVVASHAWHDRWLPQGRRFRGQPLRSVCGG